MPAKKRSGKKGFPPFFPARNQTIWNISSIFNENSDFYKNHLVDNCRVLTPDQMSKPDQTPGGFDFNN